MVGPMPADRRADQQLPDPALVVLVGASGAGKSTWARANYRRQEIVSSDDLRGIVGSGPHDLDASTDAFTLLDLIVAARLRRGMTTVVDTLGLDPEARRGYVDLARRAGVPAVAVVFDTAPALCRQRNRSREQPVPSSVLTAQLRRVREAGAAIAAERWHRMVIVAAGSSTTVEPATTRPVEPASTSHIGQRDRRLALRLQVSRFPWGENPVGWLGDIASAAEAAGFEGLALMDHLIQIPQVGRAWDPIPEPWVTLGMLAGLDTRLSLGTLVTPTSMRPAGILAKAVATLDVLSGGRAYCGIGAGWWEREHAGYGLRFPAAAERLDLLEAAIETMRALWAPGTKAYAGDRVALPETTCYPRPVSDVPIIVGGSGERRTLRIAARLGDGCNLPSDLPTLDHKLAVLRDHCSEVGRDVDEVMVTVLDLPVIGRDRDDVWARVERLRGRTAASTYAARHHAGTSIDHVQRYEELAARGVRTVFVSPPDLATPDDVLALAPVASALA